MADISITLKNVPPDLHRSLKASAQRNKRSLNQEAIHVLESSLSGSRDRRFTLTQPPPTRSVGKVLVSPKQLDSRADDLMDRAT